MSLSAEAKKLIENKAFEQAEALWMKEMESDPTRADEFLLVAKQLRQADERTRADALLELLADALKEKGAWPERLKVLRELGRLTRKPQNLRPALEEALQKTHGSRRSYKKVFQFSEFSDPAANPVERADRIENWLQFDEGECFFMSGRGAGVVVELNPDLGVTRLDFDREKRVSVPLGAAQKFLIPLPPGHLLREKIDSPDTLIQAAAKSPSETLSRLLQSFGRPMTAAEVKDAVIGIVPEAKWSSWWTAARKNPQIVVAGAGAKATYAWSSSTDAAEASVTKKFDAAPLRQKVELAKKHSARSGALADYFSQTIAREAEKVARAEPALAWEAFATLEKLPGQYETTFDPGTLLSSPMASRVVSSISDRNLREKAIRGLREKHPDWQKAYAELFFMEEDPRSLSAIIAALEEAGAVEIRDRLLDETLRYPRRHPKAFFWFCKNANEAEELSERASFTLLQQMLDAISSDEFASVKPRLREFFDKGALGIRIIQKSMTEEQGRKLVDTLERYGSLEEYRREFVRAAALMRYPALREPQVEPIYTTAESLQAKRAEFEKLKNVEMPANLKAIQVAREMGDLRENFEYKAARQRQEYLAARLTELSGELNRVRVLDPSEVDASEVRIGTRVILVNGDVRREVTILGPWESSPEHGVYSNQSEIAGAMLGKHTGDIVTFMGNDYSIERIEKWR